MPSAYKTCPGCGLMLASETVVCGRCGNRFEAAYAPAPSPPPLPARPAPYQGTEQVRVPLSEERRQKIVAIALALGLGGIGAHGFYLRNYVMGATLAVMFVGGAALGIVFYVLALMDSVPMWMTGIGLVPLFIAATVPLLQAARYGAADPEQFHRRYIVEKRWF